MDSLRSATESRLTRFDSPLVNRYSNPYEKLERSSRRRRPSDERRGNRFTRLVEPASGACTHSNATFPVVDAVRIVDVVRSRDREDAFPFGFVISHRDLVVDVYG